MARSDARHYGEKEIHHFTESMIHTLDEYRGELEKEIAHLLITSGLQKSIWHGVDAKKSGAAGFFDWVIDQYDEYDARATLLFAHLTTGNKEGVKMLALDIATDYTQGTNKTEGLDYDVLEKNYIASRNA